MEMRAIKTKYLYLFIWPFLALLACEDNLGNLTPDTVVVEAYLYVNQPVTNVRVTQLVPIGQNTTQPTPINNAEIQINTNGQSYLLTPSAGDSGYYHYAGNDLAITAGESYSLEVKYQERVITAITTAPVKPSGLALTKDTLRIAPIRSVIDIGNRQTEDLDVNWVNPSQDYHFVLVENIEVNPPRISPSTDGGLGTLLPTDPIRGDSRQVVGAFLNEYGTHRVILFRINQEYVDLYNSAEQDSRNLNEPLTNISNGLGIFTCINADTSSFFVRRP